ncbi:moaC family domain-containing protein [Ditylenchus destructor]|uniref:cyclic pyranopterin monophosphate synthase n=1 Tax=Ditylenchus destructor TaxID=166010 RepID=A0AAD4N9P0_9BILA|nr:moaC family domain-containing protein [Ditylenchus destructor]
MDVKDKKVRHIDLWSKIDFVLGRKRKSELLNCVVIRGINDDEVCDFVGMTRDRNIDVRFIEYMPFGGNSFAMKKLVSYKEMLTKIGYRYPEVIRLQDSPNSTSKAYMVHGFKGQFSFISSMSEHFCDTCNRLRITADGNLKVCLHGNTEVSLRDKMRTGATDEELLECIRYALSKKKKQHAGVENLISMTNRPMIKIGNLGSVFNPKLFSLSNISLHSRRKFLVPHLLLHCRMSSTYSNTSDPNQTFTPKEESKSELTHLDSMGRAKMVDVSRKSITVRIATAEAIVQFTAPVFNNIFMKSALTPKGDVFSVAKIAGILAAKRTSDLIPLCHQIPLSHVDINFTLNANEKQVIILCQVKTSHTTGVEMEALVAASIASLTIYDMCKAMSHEIIIGPVRLIGKSGGKRDLGHTGVE